MKKHNYEEICEGVQRAAKSAGLFIAEQRTTFSLDRVEFKGAHDMVSYVDRQAEKMVVKELRKLLPEAGFITEEGTTEEYKGEQFKWVIDPLDGTTNFVHGLSPYCVSLALMDRDEVVVGVVYEITHDEMFYAWQGSDAYMNGKRIEVSKVSKLENALVAIGFSYSALELTPHYLETVAYYQRATNGVRRLGSAAADLVYVACGRMDAYAQIMLSSWDAAAGALIALRAGARVTDNSGGDDYIFGREIVATNPLIYDEFFKTIEPRDDRKLERR